MSNFKTTVVVCLLLAILYGVYTVLQQPPLKPPKDFGAQEEGELDLSIEEDGLEGLEETPAPAKVSRASATPKRTSREERFGSASSSGKNPTKAGSNEYRMGESRRKTSARSAAEGDRAGDGDESKFSKRAAVAGREQEEMIAADGPSLPEFPATDSPRATESMTEVPPPALSPRHPRRSNPASATDGSNPVRRASSNLPVGPQDANHDPAVRPAQYDAVRTASSESPLPTERRVYSSIEPASMPASEQIAVPDDKGNSSPDMPRIQYNPFVTSRERTGGITPATEYANRVAFEQAVQNGRLMIAEQRWRDALLTLSTAFDAPGLRGEQREQLLELLDPLAGKVIYSSEHLLESPHIVRRGETLSEIADQYEVPWQLLQKINEVRDPEYPIPASALKVIRGPFHAVVDLSTNEITLKVQRMYAGRFPISVGRDPEPLAGEYQVREKTENHPYYAADGEMIAGDDPNNPYGRHWINLGREVAIHGSSLTNENTDLGSISLSPKDADDIFSILSVGSKVTIRR